MREFGIIVFGHTRARELGDLLESLKRQGAINYVDLWLDGYQGKSALRSKVDLTQRVASGYAINSRRFHRGQLGFRKMMLQAMQSAVTNYKHILFLEDDCFPNRYAVETFRDELTDIAERDEVFSVYGHHFGMAEESGLCSRFQGWGWATTATKLTPYVNRLISCYSMSEQDYLDFTHRSMSDDIITRLDVTPPRLPSETLRAFFAWDETLALLTALDGSWHKPTHERVIFNCGLGDGSAHFGKHAVYKEPPYNMISPEDVWDHF